MAPKTGGSACGGRLQFKGKGKQIVEQKNRIGGIDYQPGIGGEFGQPLAAGPARHRCEFIDARVSIGADIEAADGDADNVGLAVHSGIDNG